MRSRDFLAIAVLVLVAGGCTEMDETVVVDVSTMVPSLSDSDLATQSVEVGVLPGEGTIQNVFFDRVELLFLTLDEFEKDMTFEANDCRFFDAWNTPVFSLGKCASGLIVDGDNQAHTMLLEVRILSMTVQRTPPLFLPPGGDYDGDQVANADDNCVLIDNPDQTDTGMKGYGDACAAFDFFLGIALPDSDSDRIADSTDNCPYTPNPGQEDAGIDLGDLITVPDGIGDACVTETATVTLDSSTTIELSTGPLTAVLPFRQVRWLTVDIRDEASLSDCWNGGSCALNADEVVLCLDETGGFGCD
jgi:hypothetical protein